LLKQREELSYFLKDENRVNFQAAVSQSQEDMIENIKCLYTIPYSKLNMQIGFPKTHEIEAGKLHYTIIEVDQPSSIISIMFQTAEYDIQFGFYRANDSQSVFEVINEGEEDEMLTHPVETMEKVFPM